MNHNGNCKKIRKKKLCIIVAKKKNKRKGKEYKTNGTAELNHPELFSSPLKYIGAASVIQKKNMRKR